jgi:hypothetical protein
VAWFCNCVTVWSRTPTNTLLLPSDSYSAAVTLSPQGTEPVMTIDGAMNAEALRAYACRVGAQRIRTAPWACIAPHPDGWLILASQREAFDDRTPIISSG